MSVPACSTSSEIREIGDSRILLRFVQADFSLSLLRSELQEDFRNFDQIFDQKYEVAFEGELENGWRLFFDLWNTSGECLPNLSCALYVELLHCTLLSGSKKLEKRFLSTQRLRSELVGFYDAWQKLDALKEQHREQPLLDRATEEFVRQALHNDPALVTSTSESTALFMLRTKRISRLTLYTSYPHLLGHFPNLREFCSIIRQSWDEHARLISCTNLFQKLSLSISKRQEVYLNHFERCTALTSLTLTCEQEFCGIERSPNTEVLPFANPNQFTSLTELNISYATVPSDTLFSIAKLNLSRLGLQNCRIASPNGLYELAQNPHLHELDLRNVQPPLNFHLKSLRRHIKETCQFLPEVDLGDYRDFSKVLCSETETANESDTANALNYMGDIEPNTLFNILNLEMNISPIRCVDTRPRFAAQEPRTPAEQGDFMSALYKLNISVVVMVKEGSDSYYPTKEFSFIRCRSRTSQRIFTSDLQSERALDFGACERQFTIDDKLVYHLQIDWPDGHKLESERLFKLLTRVKELEQINTTGGTLVHCLAGEGRTGTFFGALIIDQLLRKNGVTSDLQANVARLIKGLRQYRNSMVHTPEQAQGLSSFFCLAKAHYLAQKSSTS